MSYILKLGQNKIGKDYIVGDIHGNFSGLRLALNKAGFDEQVDRLISVGDLVDRGDESHKCLEWLAKDWFYAVRGNHEQMTIAYYLGVGMDDWLYSHNGGDWFIELSTEEREVYYKEFMEMPLAIEIGTNAGRVGVIHAEVPYDDWDELEQALEQGIDEENVYDTALWERDRISSQRDNLVKGIDHVIVGHTPLRDPLRLGNVYYIDTKGWLNNGYFTLITEEDLL